MGKRLIILGFFLSILFIGQTQIVFRSVISQPTVVQGESFQVQYIFEDAERTVRFSPPDLARFRIIAGPDAYAGSTVNRGKSHPVKNWVYTLSCLDAGNFVIPGALCTVGNNVIRSNPVSVEVISPEEASRRLQKDAGNNNSEYYLRPGEDPSEKIRRNLYLKAWVDHVSCFVGEPVVATFKLYSRLESKSDIVKNPGFYGFTVYDMVNLSDKQVSTENINGKLFDVHTIRRVQLYPLQDGTFMIDPMEVKNKVEFSRRSTVNKRAEQEILEGVQGMDEEEKNPEGTETYESEMQTTALSIRVKPLPVKNKPAAYAGAVGSFKLASRLNKSTLSGNEEGILEVEFSGKGNFIQLSAPAIDWPAGLEGFEATVKDSLDKTQIPLTGKRVYQYAFSCAKPGSYSIPALHFSYFNPDSGRYVTISSEPLSFVVSEEAKQHPVDAGKNQWANKGIGTAAWTTIIAALIAIGIGTWYGIYRKKKSPKPGIVIILDKQEDFNLGAILAPVYQSIQEPDYIFYQTLQQATWNFFNYHFALSGTDRKKDVLASRLRSKGLDEKLVSSVYGLLLQCETGMFGKSEPGLDKEGLLRMTKELLEQVHTSLL